MMVVIFGVKCRCANESHDEQVKFLFQKYDEEAQSAIKKWLA